MPESLLLLLLLLLLLQMGSFSRELECP